MKIFYICVLIFLVICFRLATKEYGPNGIHNNKAYCKSKDSISTILDRIDWANNYNGRMDTFYRYIFYAIIIAFINSIVIQNNISSPLIYTQCIITTFVMLRAFHFFTQHHCDKFCSYAIDRNIKILRKRLKIKKEDKLLSETTKKFLPYSDCWNFIYK